MLKGLRIWSLNTGLAVFLATGIFPATGQTPAEFGDLIRTEAGMQAALERCDGHPEFETALANWLEAAEPSSPADRRAVREASLRLLEDTADRQLALGLSDGLLRHALEDVKRDQTIAPQGLARALYGDISRAVRNQWSKGSALAIQAQELGTGGVKDERQASFLGAMVKLAEPRVARVVKPPQSQPGEAARSVREQSDQRQRLLGP